MLTMKFAEGAKQQTPVQGRRKGNMLCTYLHVVEAIQGSPEHIHGITLHNLEKTERRIDVRSDIEIELLNRDRCVR